MTDRSSRIAFRLAFAFLLITALVLVPFEWGLIPLVFSPLLNPLTAFVANLGVLVPVTLILFFVLQREFHTRYSAEDALRRLQTDQQTILDNSQESFILVDSQGVVRSFNQIAVERTRVLTGQELARGVNIRQFTLSGHENDMRAQIERGLGGEMLAYEVKLAPPAESWLAIKMIPVLAPDGQVRELCITTLDITTIRATEQAEREQRQIAEALRDTAALLNSTLNLEELIERILENVGRVVPHQAASIMLLKGDLAHVVGLHGYGDGEHQQQIASLAHDVHRIFNLSQILATNQPYLIADTKNEPRWVIVPQTAWVRSNLCAPIRLRQEIIGFLNLDSATPNFFSDSAAARLQAFADQAAVAIENARLLEATRANGLQLEALNRAAVKLQESLNPREIYRAAGDELRQLGTFAQVYEYTPAGFQHIYTAMDDGLLQEYMTRFDQVHFEPVIPVNSFDDAVETLRRGGIIAREPIPQFDIEAIDPTAAPVFAWFAQHIKLNNVLIAPLTVAGRLSGILAVVGSAMTESERVAVAIFARHVSAALENARLFAETRRRLRELDAVNRISTALREANTQEEMTARILEETLAILEAHDGQIAFLDPSRRELMVNAARGWFAETPRAAPADDGIAGHVLATNQPYVTHDFRSDAATSELARAKVPGGRGGAVVPVRNMREPIGVLAVGVNQPRELQASEVALLTTIAEIAGNAFSRANFYAQTERRVQQLAALRTIDTAIAASTDLTLTLDILLAQACEQLHVDAADVLTFNAYLQTLEFAAGRGFRTTALQHTNLRLGDGYAGTAALERRMIVVPELYAAIDGLVQAPLLPNEGFATYIAVPLVAKGALQGVLELFTRTAIQPDTEWMEFASAVASQAALTIDNAELFRSLQNKNLELALAYDSTIEGWSRALDLRDKETEGHAKRVTELTIRLARVLGISEEELVQLRRGALLHDIGKMGIPDSILLKPGTLTEDEWKIMRRHPQLAYEMLSSIPYLRGALSIPYCHHERWDGTGYPRGLTGEEIPFEARIFAVVDAWDALRSDRPYRAGWSDPQVRTYLAEQAGKAFDPSIIATFLKMV